MPTTTAADLPELGVVVPYDAAHHDARVRLAHGGEPSPRSTSSPLRSTERPGPRVHSGERCGGLDASPDHHVDDPRAGLAAAYALRATGLPVAGRGARMSLGTDAPLDERHLHHVERWCRAARAVWYSEHAGFTRVPVSDAPDGRLPRRGLVHGDEVLDLQASHPLPRTGEAADVLARNARDAARVLPCPLLLSNVPRAHPIPGDLTEGEFLARVASRAGAALLLDVAALVATAANEGAYPRDALAGIPLGDVAVARVSGVAAVRGRAFPTASAPVPDDVWRLLEAILEGAGVRAVIVDGLPAAGALAADVARARALWERARPHAVPPAAAPHARATGVEAA